MMSLDRRGKWPRLIMVGGLQAIPVSSTIYSFLARRPPAKFCIAGVPVVDGHLHFTDVNQMDEILRTCDTVPMTKVSLPSAPHPSMLNQNPVLAAVQARHPDIAYLSDALATHRWGQRSGRRSISPRWTWSVCARSCAVWLRCWLRQALTKTAPTRHVRSNRCCWDSSFHTII